MSLRSINARVIACWSVLGYKAMIKIMNKAGPWNVDFGISWHLSFPATESQACTDSDRINAKTTRIGDRDNTQNPRHQ